jgi:hypothetical protein
MGSQHRHSGVVAVDTLARQHVRPYQRHQRRQRRRAGANPVGQRGDAEVDALTGKSLTLAVQRPMLGELGVQDRGQQIRPGATARERMVRCRRLGALWQSK